jgi:serine/threonine protein phosphatase PrpC
MAASSVGVCPEPEIRVFNHLSPSDKFLVLASDGIWDRISNEEVMQTIATKFYPKKDAEGACSMLVREAIERW